LTAEVGFEATATVPEEKIVLISPTDTPTPWDVEVGQSASITPSKTDAVYSTREQESTSTAANVQRLTPTTVGGGLGQIAFASSRSGLPQIWISNIDGSELHQITDVPSGACQPDWSPYGDQLVFISPCNDDRNTYIGSALFTIEVDGSNMVSFPIQGIGNYDPAWSPDGKLIAFTALREVERPQIWLLDLETNELLLLSRRDYRDFQPSWSPDGSRIIFISTRQGPYQVWTMNPDGNNQERFSVSGDLKNTNPVLSPNGQLLAFTQSEGVGSIPRLKGVKFPDGAAQEFFLFTSFVYPMREANFSPDGFWIVFESWPDGENHDVYFMSTSGAGLTQVTQDPALDFDPVWRPEDR
jgi:Tol biopolymer transport system component